MDARAHPRTPGPPRLPDRSFHPRRAGILPALRVRPASLHLDGSLPGHRGAGAGWALSAGLRRLHSPAMKQLLLSSIVGGLIAFAWLSVSWMMLPWHKAARFTDDTEVAAVLKRNAPSHAVYLVPNEAHHTD